MTCSEEARKEHKKTKEFCFSKILQKAPTTPKNKSPKTKDQNQKEKEKETQNRGSEEEAEAKTNKYKEEFICARYPLSKFSFFFP